MKPSRRTVLRISKNILSIGFIAVVLALAVRAGAEDFKSPKQCIAGRKAADRLGKTGTIVGMDKGDAVGCRVKLDDGSNNRAYLKIVFRGGVLAKYYAKLLAGPIVGLNGTGENFYNTTCELRR